MKTKNCKTELYYSISEVPSELKYMLKHLGEEYQLKANDEKGIKVKFIKSTEKNMLKVVLKDDIATIYYGQISLAARGVGALLANIVENNSELIEKMPFDLFGIMLDCSRNAVMTVRHFKNWLRRLALMGYNNAMLYTEDTYEIDGERFFGFMRGAYTPEELREIDQYASELGIEMIPCIQTLGHLEQILKWPAYDNVKDTETVLLTNNKKSYDLIEKMIKHWLSCFKTRRVHIGMDEAHDMGRGKYMDKFGYKRGFEVFNEHLDKLVAICKKHGYKSMIWSDMYFRMGSKTGDYYDKETLIPECVKDKISKDTDLVYWDYYHADKEFYNDWLERHLELGFKPIMGSGVWTWGYFWHNQTWTERYVGPCIDSCIEKGIDEIFFTMWGDDGAYCDFDSAMSGLLWTAEKAFCNENIDDVNLEKRFDAICKGSYQTKVTVSEINLNDFNITRYLLWDDPLLNINLMATPSVFKQPGEAQNISIFDAIDSLRQNLIKVHNKLEKYSEDLEGGDISYALSFIRLLKIKLELSKILLKSYMKRDQSGLANVRKMIPEVIASIKAFDISFRQMWLRHNKPFGLEVIQIRNAGLVRRFEELDMRIEEFLENKIDTIPEIDEVVTSLNSIAGKKSKCEQVEYPFIHNYKDYATSSFIL